MICVLSGGTGGAKFVDGLRQVVPPEEITIIVNTGDDLMWWGLYVSPDIDSITYVLSGLLSRERGWGVKGDTFLCLQAMGQLGEPTWFHTGDRVARPSWESIGRLVYEPWNDPHLVIDTAFLSPGDAAEMVVGASA